MFCDYSLELNIAIEIADTYLSALGPETEEHIK